MQKRGVWLLRLLDVFWGLALGAYIWAGYGDVPFHGDESMQIAVSRDYAYIFQDHDPAAVFYDPNDPDTAMSELRVVNGTIPRWAIGLGWAAAGLSADDLNDPWDWGLDWDANAAAGNLPSERLLRAARRPSTLLTVLSAWGLFVIVRRLHKERIAAYVASGLYATMPIVLVNGRRAVLEGPLLAGAVLVALGTLWTLYALQDHRAHWWHYALLGVASAFAVAAKHTNVLIVAWGFVSLFWAAGVWNVRRNVWPGLLLAGTLSVEVFLLLNPSWWSDVCGMPARVATMRKTLLDAQRVTYGGYPDWGAGLAGMVRHTLYPQAQYFEAPPWANYAPLQTSIAAYEKTLWAGWRGGVWSAAVLLTGLGWGTAWFCSRRREPEALFMLLWMWGSALVLWLTIPFGWQRYYLPLSQPLAVFAGVGWAWALGALRGALPRQRAVH